MRTDLLRGADGTVTFGDAYQVQPFVNSLEVRTLTGAQIERSSGATVPDETGRLDAGADPGAVGVVDLPHRPCCACRRRIADLRVDGTTVVPDGRYRVAVNKFLADGGDGFTALRGGTEPASAGNDLEALTSYLEAHSPVAPPAPGRIAIAAPN
ncbi:hypothetical protein GS432_10000 [Rhodococcus hoagii]|nr:hypothetical protein [Prescottella equi]